ncbi:MAG TPA: ankyrin repeat domain-containing protein [Methylomirabilota bacterium]
MDEREFDADRSRSVGIGPAHVDSVESQQRALTELMAGIDAGGRWVLLLGSDGVGKSTVLRRLVAEVELADADVVACQGSEVAAGDQLVAVLQNRLELSPPATRRLRRARPVQDLLVNQRARRRPLVVLIDDAHVLSRPSLAVLAELAAKPSASDPAVFVVLAGGPGLERPALRAWGAGGRGVVTCRVAPLTVGEVRPYVERHMRSGIERSVEFSEAAIQRIFTHTRGAPGLINALCERMITHPSFRLTDRVSADSVDEAAERLGLRTSPTRAAWGPVPEELAAMPEDRRSWGRSTSRLAVRGAALLAGAMLVAGLAIYVGPGLLRSLLDWVGPEPEAARSTQGPEGLGPSRQGSPRREAASTASSPGRGRAAPGAGTPGRLAADQRSAKLEHVEKAAPIQRAERAPRPVAPSSQQTAALLDGARHGQVAELSRLLASGVPANVPDANGFTPLMLAVVHGQLPAARALIDGGAQVNARNDGGITPVMLAVINERAEALELLLDRGADVNARSGTGWTALTFAAWKGDANLVRMLLNHGANPAAVDKQRWTPLDYAVSKPRSSSNPAEGTEAGSSAPADPGGGKHPEVTPSPEPSGAR